MSDTPQVWEMSRAEHVFRMAAGFILYWIIAVPMPVRWWTSERDPFWWALPLIGYYAFHPRELGWLRPMPRKAAHRSWI